MKYPDDFNTPAFPAGKFVAVSRFMAVTVMVLFFLIICLCGIILWAKRTQEVSPFLIAINPNGEKWTVVAHDNHKNQIPAYYVLQESLLNDFTRNWFTISDNILDNQAIWSDECNRNSPECVNSSTDGIETCAIYCSASDYVFDDFKKTVLPIYSDLESKDAAIWHVVDVNIRPVDMQNITEYGGVWKLDALVDTGLENIVFSGYARVAYDKMQYPKTMGYYVSEYYMYRMN